MQREISILSFRFEKRGEDGAAFVFPHAADNFSPTVERGGAGYVERAAASAAFLFVRAEINFIYASVHYRAGAHRTGFERNVDFRAGKPPIVKLFACAAYGYDFRMSGRVFFCFPLVLAAGNYFAAKDDYTADGYLPFCSGMLCLFNSFAHETMYFFLAFLLVYLR